jgi:hypothetical protein
MYEYQGAAREGGMFDLAGWPTVGARAVIEPDRKIIEAALWNVENLFGWVTTTDGLLAAFAQ